MEHQPTGSGRTSRHPSDLTYRAEQVAAGLRLSWASSPQGRHLVLEGEADRHSAAALHGRLLDAVLDTVLDAHLPAHARGPFRAWADEDPRRVRVLVDLTRLDFCDLHGLEALRGALFAACEAGLLWSVTGMSTMLRRLDAVQLRSWPSGVLPGGALRRSLI